MSRRGFAFSDSEGGSAIQFVERSGRDRGWGHEVEVRQVGSLVGEARVRPSARCTSSRAERRSRVEQWEVGTVLGESAGGACIATLVERRTDDVAIGKLKRGTRPPESATGGTHPVPDASRAHDHGGRRK